MSRETIGRPLVPMASVASAGAGMFAIVWLAALRLNSHEQGYFFTFLSFGGLVQLSDFGLSYAVLQTGGRLAGTGRLGELGSLARFVGRWNLLVSSVSTAVAGGLGWMVFSHQVRTESALAVEWSGPWGAYLLGVLLTQLGTPGIHLREGGGKVLQMWRLRLIQEWIAAGACLLALEFGTGLWSLAAYSSARGVVSALWLRLGDPMGASPPGVPAFTLRRWAGEVWPFQWKLGVSALSGFLIFRAFSPILLVEKGPVLAGQFGLAIAMMNLLLAISSAWPMSQTARYAKLSAERRFVELDREFPGVLWRSTAVSLAGAIALSLVLWQGRRFGMAFAERLTDPMTTAVVLLAAVVHHVVGCAAVFLRAEGREPLVIPSVVGAVATAVGIWLAARHGSVRTIAVTNLLLTTAGIPVAYLLLHFRQRERSG